ncbi:MAG: hypothetical protein ACOYN8_18280 [Pseudanabaena sp.]|jgi:cytochrome c-type biogenesis protein CcmH/NrfG
MIDDNKDSKPSDDKSVDDKGHEVHIDTKYADEEFHKVLKEEFKTYVNKYSSPFSRKLIFVDRFAFLILLCLSSFIAYQQWQQSQQINQLVNQQSQQINQLVKQLTPAIQKGSSNK